MKAESTKKKLKTTVVLTASSLRAPKVPAGEGIHAPARLERKRTTIEQIRKSLDHVFRTVPG